MKEQKLHQGHFGKKPQKAVKNGQYNKTGDTAKISHAAKTACENFAACKIVYNYHSPSIFSSLLSALSMQLRAQLGFFALELA